jgi:Ca-activated chloride channel family protein
MRIRYPLVLSAVLAVTACTPVSGPTTAGANRPNAQSELSQQEGRHDGTARPGQPLGSVSNNSAAEPAPEARQRSEYAATGAVIARHAPLKNYGTGLLSVPRHPVVAPTVDRENYAEIDSNGIMLVARQPVSTLSIDVDTASYTNVRRILNEGRWPPGNAVRVEEMINYFDYDDPTPTSRDEPFHISTEIAPTPWNSDTRLLRVGLQAWDVARQDLPASNLVFLVDVSGSMKSADKLPLLKKSLLLLSKRMTAQDRISLVVYAGAAGVVLEPTPGNERARIAQALTELSAGGSTHGSAGIELAYAKAREAYIEGGINRVIVATDGDFNVGTVDHQALLDLVEREREAGIALTTLGFGRGNINDHLMEQLADHGNGNYGYIDSLMEAQKVLVEQIGSTLYTVASDVKLQIEFNPERIAEYRLIGYENRLLAREDFNNDRVDAGELGAGHSIVALYEIAETDGKGRRIDDLRYGRTVEASQADDRSNEYAHVKLRYKPSGSSTSKLLSLAVTDRETTATGSDNLRFAAAVSAFGQKLRGGEHLDGFSFSDIRKLAQDSRGDDLNGYRGDFLRLVALADSLSSEMPATMNKQARND